MSDKTISQKLGLKPGQRFLLLNAPINYRGSLGPLPNGVRLSKELGENADVIQIFASSRSELVAALSGLKARLNPNGIIWITYPKGTSKITSEINRDSIREYAATVGLEAIAIFSVDDDWSALRLKVAR